MKVFLVGGAVRDRLLNRPIKERDWVVVGATVSEMIKKGFRPVGKDFPVFLHPESHEEYALARTERKTGRGYKGFVFYTSKKVTLKDDLKRRDLTVNAMAQDESNHIIDPFGGQADLKKRMLRHVSEAFVEDPVRILRVARFSSRYGNFRVAKETTQLMKTIVKNEELLYLTPERVWQELSQSLTEKYPWRFIEVLKRCGALTVIFPEIDSLFQVPEPAKWHPEENSGLHTLLALKQASRITGDPVVRFAVLVHDIGKTQSPKETWPKHHNHYEAGVALVKRFCRRWKVPRVYQELAVLVTRYHGHCHRLMELKPSTMLKLLQSLDAFRRPSRFKQFLQACEADARGRKGLEHEPYKQAVLLEKIYEKCAAIDIKCIFQKAPSGTEIQAAIYRKRLDAIKKALANEKSKMKGRLS